MARKKTIPWTQVTDRLCSLAEAAETLGLSESSIKDYCRSETLTAERIGRAWIIDRLSVEQLAQERAA